MGQPLLRTLPAKGHSGCLEASQVLRELLDRSRVGSREYIEDMQNFYNFSLQLAVDKRRE